MNEDLVLGFFISSVMSLGGFVIFLVKQHLSVIDRNTQAFIKLMTFFEKNAGKIK